MSYVQQKIRVEIPYGYTPAQREEIGKEIINFIRMRTKADNIDKSNRSFEQYSQKYESEKGTPTVNLTKTGDMLESLQVLKTYSTFITIGYPTDYDGMGKVEGNRKGTYGNKKPVVSPRDFLGITQGDLNSVLSKFERDDRLAGNQDVLIESARRLTPEQRERLERDSFLSNINITNNLL